MSAPRSLYKPQRIRRWWRPLALVAAAVASGAAASEGAAVALADARGLQFSSRGAFCAFHCGATHFTAAECSPALCGSAARKRRRLAGGDADSVNADLETEDDDVKEINFLACRGVAQSATSLSLSLGNGATVAGVFRDFHAAFFAAFDAMVASENATYDACQLQFVQDKLLPTAVDADDTTTIAARKPMLVQLEPTGDERECVKAVKTIWSDENEAMTPLLARRGDRSGAAFTALLLHVDDDTASAVSALDCVRNVTELPPVLKLLPFARSAAQLSVSMATPDEVPAMEIRLVDGSDAGAVLTHLQSSFRQQFGVLNVYETAGDSTESLFVKPLQDLTTWSHAVALAVSDAAVEWMDVRASISQNYLPDDYLRRFRAHTAHRRLDEYVDSLIGVDGARAVGIRGNDVIVGITDSGLYLNHDQFDQDSRNIFESADTSARKVVYYNAWADDTDQSDSGTCGHGTHVAGILAGSSFNGTHEDLGIADRARIAFMDIGTQSSSCAGQSGCAVQLATPAKASDLLESQMNVGAKIFSFSWGTPGSDYSAQARDLDDFIYQNSDVLVVVAAGNSGESADSGTISSPSGAKNVISVGASLNSADSFSDVACLSVFNEYSIASFSSSGPTSDGRLKPDVVAPGMRVVSSQSEKPGSSTKTAATCSLQGTSQSTPVITGMAVLLFEWLRDGWWKDGTKNSAYAMSSVPAALLKALIIHSGEPLQRRLAALDSVVSCSQIEKDARTLTTFPNVFQGYGKPNLSNIVDFSSSNAKGDGTTSLYFLPNSTEGSEPRVAHNQSVIISFTVSKDVDLRTTLVWTDPPGSVRSTTQLQHDLDLSVRIRNGSEYFYPVTAANATHRDDTNNVEVVLVTYDELLAAANNSVGESGEIVVEAVVFGRSVLLADSQAFAFVASSSAIGSASGFADAADTTSGSSGSPWCAWMIAAVAGGALLLLLLITACVRWRMGRQKRRRRRAAAAASATSRARPERNASTSFNAFTTPPAAMRGDQVPPYAADKCPFCHFTSADPVIMVNHVENLHRTATTASAPVLESDTSRGMPIIGLASTSPMSNPLGNGHTQTSGGGDASEQQCPFCRFTSADAVILVNHVEHMHGA